MRVDLSPQERGEVKKERPARSTALSRRALRS
jgi:hypothetical protein